MLYRKGYRYQIAKDYTFPSYCHWLPDFEHEYFHAKNGFLTLHSGYAYDGASGPVFQSPNSVRGTGFHDAGYQAIRLGLCPEDLKEVFDMAFRDILRADRMWRVRAWVWYQAVLELGPKDGGRERPILETPKGNERTQPREL